MAPTPHLGSAFQSDDAIDRAFRTDPVGGGAGEVPASPGHMGGVQGAGFHGRTAAVGRITDWISGAAVKRRALLVTGGGGVGKSAVLARVVTAPFPADVDAAPGTAGTPPPGTPASDSPAGLVDCAVDAGDRTALEVARLIAGAARARLPEHVGDLPPALHQALKERSVPRFTVVIDGLDAAVTPEEAHTVITWVLRPLVLTCARAGLRLVVGTRPHDADGGDLLAAFGTHATVLNLETPKLFAGADLAAHTLATLHRTTSEESAGQPPVPADERVTARVAERITALAGRNFLLAGLLARTHALHGTQQDTPAPTTSSTCRTSPASSSITVREALLAYLAPLPAVDGVAAAEVLTALALAQAPGLPTALWADATAALTGTTPSQDALRAFTHSPTARFLIHTSTPDEHAPDGSEETFHLRHRAVADALVAARAATHPQAADERALTQALFAHGQALGWHHAPAYLLRSLPHHAARAGTLDHLLTDDHYLLHADLRRLTPLAHHAVSPPALARARLLRCTRGVFDAPPDERVGLFSLTEARDPSLGDRYSTLDVPAPYRAVWATPPHRAEAILRGHSGRVQSVRTVRVDGRTLLATAASDGVRLWDPTTGACLRTVQGSSYGVGSVEVDGRTLLVTGGSGFSVHLWDATTGKHLHTLRGHTHNVHGFCVVEAEGRVLLASASGDRTVRLWDPVTGEHVRTLQGHEGGVERLCTVEVDGRTLLASASADGTVRLWDPASGEHVRTLDDGAARVGGVRAVEVDGRTLLASASGDGAVRLWDPASGACLHTMRGHPRMVSDLCTAQVDGRAVLVSAVSGTVEVWDPATGDQLRTVYEGSLGVCAVEVDGRSLIASATDDGTVRLWDPATGEGSPSTTTTLHGNGAVLANVVGLEADGRSLLASGSWGGAVRLWDPLAGAHLGILTTHTNWVRGLCAVEADGRTLIASASRDRTVRLSDPVTGACVRTLDHPGGVEGVCAVRADGRTLLASGCSDRGLRLWDPATGRLVHTVRGHTGKGVWDVCAVDAGGETLLASAGDDGTVRLWDPVTGDHVRTLTGHARAVHCLCAVEVDGRDLLVSAGDDRMVRVWSPLTGALLHTLEGHTDGVRGVCAVDVGGRALLVSASWNDTVRLWDPGTGSPRAVIPVDRARSLTSAGGHLVVGLDGGLLALALHGDLASPDSKPL